MKAIPTKYAGVQFRSRLEARWAAFFDLLKWRWEYEPVDLGGWIPDFSLHGAGGRVLVEVKPWSCLGEWDFELDKIDRAMAAHPWCCTEVLLLGSGFPTPVNDGAPYSLVGFSGETTCRLLECHGAGDSPERYYTDAAFTKRNGLYGFCSSVQDFTDRITGVHGEDFVPSRSQELELLWREAGNRVQWNAPRERAEMVESLRRESAAQGRATLEWLASLEMPEREEIFADLSKELDLRKLRRELSKLRERMERES